MNTANLQLEGLLMAVAAINRALVGKGLLTTEEMDRTLARSEQTVLGDDRVAEDMSPANRDAVAFPARFLRLANNMASDAEGFGFAELARMVGQTKGPHNDNYNRATHPDGRYVVVRGRLWRTANPNLSPSEREPLVGELMDARRRVRSSDTDEKAQARRDVDAAKHALGERGAVWWDDGSPDYNRWMAKNTPHRDWFVTT